MTFTGPPKMLGGEEWRRPRLLLQVEPYPLTSLSMHCDLGLAVEASRFSV